MILPNILIIPLVCLRTDHLSCYGYYRNTTPTIDSFATEGTLFEQAYSTCCWTAPAYASLLTGLYPSCHGVFPCYESIEKVKSLSKLVPTILNLLAGIGYHTIGFLNNPHVGKYAQLDRGFQELFYYGYKPESNNLISSIKNQAKWHAPWVANILNNLRKLNSDKGAKRTTQEAIKWLKVYGQRKQPFFMLLQYNDMHIPYSAPYPHKYRFTSRLAPQVNWQIIQQVNYKSPFCDPHIMQHFTQHDFEAFKALYDAEIFYVDKWLGKLFAYMQHLSLLDKTLIIILSLHGENLGEHGLTLHEDCLYETTVHIPLIVRYPNIVPSGLRVHNLVQLTDILPTILEIVGYEKNNLTLQGKSLLPIQPNRAYHEYIIAEWEGGYIPKTFLGKVQNSTEEYKLKQSFRRTLRMVRQNNYKYIYSSDGSEELFNLSADPNELHNLVTQEPEKVCSMSNQLKKWLNSVEPQTNKWEEPDKIEQSILEHLREMGYKI